MAPRSRWTTEEKLRLLACVDYCRQHELDFEHNLPAMLAHQGFNRAWNAITHALTALAGGKRKALSSFKAQGSTFALLSAQNGTALSTYARAAAASALTSDSSLPAPSSSTVAEADEVDGGLEIPTQRERTIKLPTNRGTKRRGEPDKNVPRKRRKIIKSPDLPDQVDVQASEDSIHGTSHQMEGIEQAGGQKEATADKSTVERCSVSRSPENEAGYEQGERKKSSEAQEVRDSRESQEQELIRATSAAGAVTHPGSSDFTSQQSSGQLEDLYSQLRNVITKLHTQVNTSLRVTHQEKELYIATHKQAIAESTQLESLQRAADAETRLHEVERQLQVVSAKNQSLQIQNVELKEQVRSLDVPDHVQMRQRFREFETKENQYRIRADNQRSENREKLEIEKRNTPYAEEEARRMIKSIEDKFQAKIEHLEENAKNMEDYYQRRIGNETERNERLRHKLRVLCGDKLVGRYPYAKFPNEYSVAELHAYWADSVPKFADFIYGVYDMTAETTIREDTSIPGFQSLLRLLVGRPLIPGSDTDDLSISECFQHLSKEPTDYYLALAFLTARAVQWCFNTSWHIDGPECTRMQEVWESIAEDGGPKVVREQDMLATLRKVTNDQYREYKVPIMAKRQMAIFRKEYSRYLNLENEQLYEKLEDCLGSMMIMKLELLVSNSHNKVAFIPPGTLYDPAWMKQTGGDTKADIVQKNKEYRVRLCLSPALIKDVPEPEWQDGNALGERQNYRGALLQSRNYFPEETGQWKGWPNSRMASKAEVILEEVPSGAGSAA